MGYVVGQQVTVAGQQGTITDTVSEPGAVQVTFQDGSRKYVPVGSVVALETSEFDLRNYATSQYQQIMLKITSGAVKSVADINALKWPVSS